MIETLAEFIEERAPWLAADNPWVVGVVRTGDGGWDVVLRIDGAYTDRATAEDVAEYLRDRIARVS
jgi:hypothetical protein